MQEVDRKLHKKMMGAYCEVRNTAREYDVNWRTAAYIVALSRLETAYVMRGIFP